MTAPGSIASHDALCEAYCLFTQWNADGAISILAHRRDQLARAATLCGWNGATDLINWSANRVQTYRNNIATGFAYNHPAAVGFGDEG